MRAAIYIRVSTTEQAEEGFSISAQRERLTAYVLSQGWEITDFYVDEGRSAKDTDRPELNRMIEDVKNKLVDVVLVYKLDRLTRSVLDLYKLLDIFDKHDCKFKSATEVYDTTTAIGRLFITLVAALAQWERENLSERVSFGMTEKARQGQWHGSEAPFGYDYNVKTRELTINASESIIVKTIFNLYLSGLSDRKIAIELNQKKLLTRTNKLWTENRIRYILNNPIYVGSLRWGVRVNKEKAFEVKDAAPATIEIETFEKVHAIRNARRKFHGVQATSDYFFSGVLRCARCGSAMKGHMKKKNDGYRYKSYRCISAHYKQCDMPLISEKIVEYQFLKQLKNTLFIDMKIDNKSVQPSDNKELIYALETELEKIKARRKKWQYAWAQEMISDNEFTDRMNEEQVKETEIKKSLYISNEQVDQVKIDKELMNILSTALENWTQYDDVEKKQLVQIAIDKITIEKVPSQTVNERAKIIEIIFN